MTVFVALIVYYIFIIMQNLIGRYYMQEKIKVITIGDYKDSTLENYFRDSFK